MAAKVIFPFTFTKEIIYKNDRGDRDHAGKEIENIKNRPGRQRSCRKKIENIKNRPGRQRSCRNWMTQPAKTTGTKIIQKKISLRDHLFMVNSIYECVSSSVSPDHQFSGLNILSLDHFNKINPRFDIADIQLCHI